MLTLLPVHAAPLGRVHVGPKRPDGTLRVLDRPTGQMLLIYTPRFTAQFRAGHRAGRWYVRPALHVGAEPRSREFTSARSAVEAVEAGGWRLANPQNAGGDGDGGRVPRPALRVIWN